MKNKYVMKYVMIYDNLEALVKSGYCYCHETQSALKWLTTTTNNFKNL